MTTKEKNRILEKVKTTMEVYECPECGKIYKITDNPNSKYSIICHLTSKHPYLFFKEEDVNMYEYAKREQGFIDFLECGDK